MTLLWVQVILWCIITCCFASYSNGNRTVVDSSKVIPFLCVWFVFALFMGCVYTYFYVNQEKHVAWLEKLQSYDTSALTSFAATFGVVSLAPIVISLFISGIMHIFWIILVASFTVILPVMVVDAVYGAIWVRKHPYSFDEVDIDNLELEDDEEFADEDSEA